MGSRDPSDLGGHCWARLRWQNYSQNTLHLTAETQIKRLTVKKSAPSLPSTQNTGMPASLLNPCRGIPRTGVGNQVQKHKNREKGTCSSQGARGTSGARRDGTAMPAAPQEGQRCGQSLEALGFFQS